MKWIVLLLAVGFLAWVSTNPTDAIHLYCKIVAPEDALGVAQEACFERSVNAWNARIQASR